MNQSKKLTTMLFVLLLIAANVFQAQQVSAQTSGLWTGSTNNLWNLEGNWDDGVIPTVNVNVQIPDVSGASENFPVLSTVGNCANLTIDLSANLTIDSNAILNVKGDIMNNGGAAAIAGTGFIKTVDGAITLIGSTEFNGTVQVLTGTSLDTDGNLTLGSGGGLVHGVGTPGGGGTVSGNVTVKRTGSSGTAYNYWSSPVASASVIPGSFYFDETVGGANSSDGWKSASGTMVAGKGYAKAGGGTQSFTGTLNDGNVDIAITETIAGASDDDGYNLVGNPYPSPIKVSSFLNAGVNPDINLVIYLWDDDNSGGSGYTTADYATINNAGAISGGGNGTAFTGGNIATCQGFLVKSNGGNGTVHFTNSMRNFTSNNEFFKTGESEQQNVRINIISPSASHINQTLVALRDDASDGADEGLDAEKRFGSTDIALYSKIDVESYAIQAIGKPALYQPATVQLAFFGAEAGVYTMEFPEISGFEENETVYLEDQLTGAFIDLKTTTSYQFGYQSGGEDTRFVLHFNVIETVTSGHETLNKEKVNMFFIDGQLHISNPREIDIQSIAIYDLSGKLVFQSYSNNTSGAVTSKSISKGIYIVKVVTPNAVISGKVLN